MMTQEQPAPADGGRAVDLSDYDKINGWLLFPAYLHPLAKIGSSVYTVMQTLTVLAKPGLSAAAFAYVIAVLISNVVFGIAWGACGYFAYSLKPFFPKTYIGLSIADIAVSGLTVGVAYSVFLVSLTPDDALAMFKMIVAAAIWIPYMLLSKRVKTTFYEKMPARS